MDARNRLRQARLDHQVTIDQIAARTKLPRSIVETIDEGRIGDLPAGLYGRAYVRAFAAAVGVDPAEAVDFCSVHLVDIPDPLPGLREIVRERTAPSLAALIAERARVLGSREWWSGPFRVPGARYAAGSVDAVLLFITNAVIVGVIANACRVSVDVLLQVAGPAAMVICAFTTVAYFVLLAGVGGQTPGMRVCAVPRQPEPSPLDLRTITGRAADAAMGEASLLVDWLCSPAVPTTRESPV